MSIFKVLPCTHPDLKKKAPQFIFDEKSREHTIDPLKQMLIHLNVWGIAAPEVGLPVRIFVTAISEDQPEPQCFINPVITAKEGTILSEEDSLSLPNASIRVVRAQKITLDYQDETGENHTVIFENLHAILAQQKIDYLNGITLLDHMSNLKRERLLKKMKKDPHSHACGHGCDHHH